jgi:endonuclease/exonuclease/phosphatase (EEP) superfamily protein YafD
MPAPRTDVRRGAPAVALPWVLWAALRLTGTERGFPLVPAMTFTPYAAASALLPLGLTIRAGSRLGALLSAAAGGALAVSVLARAGRRAGPAPADGRRLRVATVSLRLGLVEPAPVLDLVRRHDVDVLSVQELTPEAERGLRAAGLDDLLPTSYVIPARPGVVPSASGAVWSRFPIGERRAVPGEFEQPTVTFPADGGPDLELTAVHITPPSTFGASVRNWASDLAALPSPEPAVLRVLAGDFNASLDHAALRAVLDRGYDDAARVVGRALTWTWRPLHWPFPRLTLDHVLIDPRIGVAAVDVVPVRGSDHRAVVAELVLPRTG